MEQVVGAECGHVLSVGVQVTNVQIGEPWRIDVDVGALQAVVTPEYFVKSLPQHATAA